MKKQREKPLQYLGCCSVAQSCLTLCEPISSVQLLNIPGFSILLHLLELTQTHVIESVMPSNHLLLCHPLLLPSIFPGIRDFSNESAKYWSFSFSISSSNEYFGLIFFWIDWFDVFAVQGTLKSLFQHHHSKTSIIWHLPFFMVQLSHPYMTTGKTIGLTRGTSAGQVMPLLFNMLPRFVIAFLPKS